MVAFGLAYDAGHRISDRAHLRVVRVAERGQQEVEHRARLVELTPGYVDERYGHQLDPLARSRCPRVAHGGLHVLRSSEGLVPPSQLGEQIDRSAPRSPLPRAIADPPRQREVWLHGLKRLLVAIAVTQKGPEVVVRSERGRRYIGVQRDLKRSSDEHLGLVEPVLRGEDETLGVQ